jgi:hypothetical protein
MSARGLLDILLHRIADGTDPLRLLWWLWLLPVALWCWALVLIFTGR